MTMKKRTLKNEEIVAAYFFIELALRFRISVRLSFSSCTRLARI